MDGSRQHAPYSAGLDLDQAAVRGGRQQNTKHHDSALAPGQISPSDPCPGSVCPVSLSAAITIPTEVYNLPVQALDLSVRLFLCFQLAGVLTVGQLLEMELEELHQVKPGEKSIQELIGRMQALNLLESAHQCQRDESSGATSVGRHDNRQLSVVASRPPLSHSLHIPDKTYFLPLATLDLSIRLFNIFQRAGVSTVGEILEMDMETLEHLKLGEKSIQEVVRKVQALDLLDPLQGLAEASLQTTPETQYVDSGTSISTLGQTSISSQEDTADPVVLTGHRYGWAVSIDDLAWSKQEQWYLDYAPGSFPYAAGTLVEHNSQPYVIKCVGTSMLRVATLQDDELGDENVAVVVAQESPVAIEQSEASQERLAAMRAPRLCFEVAVSSLPVKYRDRISRRQRTCWVTTPEPSLIRPGCFTTSIGSTPDKVRAKAPVFLTEEEAAGLAPVSQVSAPVIKVAPAFLLPEHLRRVLSSGISRPMTLWEWEGREHTITRQETVDEQPVDQRADASSSTSVPIPQYIARMPIERLDLSLPLSHRLQLAGIATVGQLLEMEEKALRALSIGAKGLQEIARCLQAVQALPSQEALVYDDIYIAVTDQGYTDEQGDQWRMVYTSVFPDRLPGAGWRSGPVYTLWMLQQHLDQAMDWDREQLAHLDTHTLRVLINEHAREQGAVAPPLRTPSPKRSDEERGLSASKNLFIPREATEGLLDDLPPGEEERRYQDRRADQLFGVLQEEWLALGRQAAAREREQRLRAGQREEAFSLEQVESCIEQVEDWYAGLRRKPRILGLCGVFAQDRVPRERTYIVRQKGRPARKKTVRWTERVPRLVGYHLVVGAPSWVVWPMDWVQQPCEERHIA